MFCSSIKLALWQVVTVNHVQSFSLIVVISNQPARLFKVILRFRLGVKGRHLLAVSHVGPPQLPHLLACPPYLGLINSEYEITHTSHSGATSRE